MSSGCAQGIKRLAQTFIREPIGEIRQIVDVSMYRAIAGRYPIKARGIQSIFTDGAAVERRTKAANNASGSSNMPSLALMNSMRSLID